ncbi:Ankyrin-1 [Cyphellophora attinorum]|uniref:Ankyrin-1 n=1 Tax=Cyphellophora attinorum TaxID=1664694 RepID=A0A0N1GYY9_9EURO|nr:Ankyrin-1 [Phialophora attinorum]KPI36177.1 Ankyrin-1 [Phialophora attinorum]
MGDPVSVASGIAGLATLAIQVAGAVYGYVSAVKERTKNVSELRDELLLLGGVLTELNDFINSGPAKTHEFDGDSVLQNALRACRQRIERIGDKLRTPDGKFKRAVERLIWPFKEEEVLSLMDSLRRYRSTFAFAADIQGYKILLKNTTDTEKTVIGIQKLEEQMAELTGVEANEKRQAQLKAVLDLLPLLKSTSNDMREVTNAARLQEMREQERRKSDILDWLCPIEDLRKNKDLQNHRTPGTGQWLLETPEFQSWLSNDVQDLVCVGGPGVGKSVLCTKILDNLVERYGGNEDIRVAHYYFDYSEVDLRNDVHMIRSILRQCCVPCATIPPAVSEFYQKTRDVEKDRTWFRKLQRVFQRVISTHSSIFLVIDALDETNAVTQRPGFFQAIQSIREEYAGLKILVTTRPHLLEVVPQYLQNSASVAVTATEEDLRRFLLHKIEKYPDWEAIFDDKLKHEVVEELCQTANGMFLLPSLQISNILESSSRADVRRSLKSLSSDLTGVFTSTIERIQRLPPRWCDIAFQTLMWLSHARRPLTMTELRHALAVQDEDEDLDEDALISPRKILEYCNGLVEHEHDSGVVHLVHYTLEEYLVSHEHNLFKDAELAILRTCLKYLSLRSLQDVSQGSRVHAQTVMARRPFGNYAASYWGFHAREIELGKYADLVLPILSSSQALMAVVKVRDANTADQRKYNDRVWQWSHAPNGGGGISLAVSFGLTELVRYLIGQQEEPNLTARNVHGSSALHEASFHGHEETAELLIVEGANIFDKNLAKSTPMYLAVSYGRISMAKVLLKYGHQQLDVQCGGGQTALHKAVDLDSETMVQFLLDSNALIGANDDRNNTPLHVAALRGSLAISKMLINAGAFISAQNRLGLTPLDLAATAGHAAVAQVLLEHGADVSHRAHDQWTALHRAARGGHVDTVVSLLEYRADLLTTDIKGNIALHHAARAGHLETVEQLIGYEPYYTEQQLLQVDHAEARPREVAFFCAHYDVHKYLRSLEWQLLGAPGAENNVTLAIERGDKDLLHSLLQQGMLNVNATDEDGQPPLHVAIQEKQEEIAELLMTAGASIEQKGYHGWRALHIAASLGDADLVDWCLQQNADVHAKTSTGQQAIHKAASSRSLPAVRRLLEAGANVEARNDRGMTPLLVASHQNDVNTVRALVREYKADPFSRDRHGFTAMHWAEKSAHFEIVKFLRQEKKTAEKEQGKLKRFGTSSSDVRLASRDSVDTLTQDLHLEELELA